MHGITSNAGGRDIRPFIFPKGRWVTLNLAKTGAKAGVFCAHWIISLQFFLAKPHQPDYLSARSEVSAEQRNTSVCRLNRRAAGRCVMNKQVPDRRRLEGKSGGLMMQLHRLSVFSQSPSKHGVSPSVQNKSTQICFLRTCWTQIVCQLENWLCSFHFEPATIRHI